MMADARRQASDEPIELDHAFAQKDISLGDEFELEDGSIEPLETSRLDEQVPPERVRFTAPVKVRTEGTDAVIDGVTLNLSVRGVAVCAPLVAKVGGRVWTRFRLGLADDELNLLTEVIWSTPAGDGDVTYGLRFVSLNDDEQAKVSAVVAERSSGRSGDWVLPMMPEPEVKSPRLGASPWVTAAAGMAAGIGLAVALSVVPSRGATQPVAAYAPSAAPALNEPVAPSLEPAEAPALPTVPVVPAPALAPAPVEPKLDAPQAVVPVVAPQPEAEKIAPAKDKSATGMTAAPATSTQLPKKSTTPPKNKGDVLKPVGTTHGVELALLADGPVGGHVSFWLEKPRRLVVDIFGRKNGFAKTSYDIEHPLAKHIRIGQHKDRVRYVIDVADNVAEPVKARAKGKTLLIELRRK